MPLHIVFDGEHYSIYEVSLGGLAYMGSFTEPEFVSWLRQSIENRGRKPAAKPSLNIELEL